MQHNLSAHNVNNADIIRTWSAHAANPNDIMLTVCNMCAQASQASLTNIDVPHST